MGFHFGERARVDERTLLGRARKPCADAQRRDDPSGAAITLMRMSSLALDAGEAAQALTHARDAVEIARLGAFRIDDTDTILQNLGASLPVKVRYLTRYWVSVEPV